MRFFLSVYILQDISFVTAVHAIRVDDGTFSHLKDKPPVLHDVQLEIKEKSLTAVVGPVGAGKSSLLSALIGDIHKRKGVVTLKV